MPRCSYCGNVIVFGGVKEADARYCNDTCRKNGFLNVVAERIPSHLVAREMSAVHQGECPKCNGPGPVDVHVTHTVWSAIWFTSHKNAHQVSCRSCAVKSKVGGILFSGLFGWWGFPWGLVFTPLQIYRNIRGILSPPDSSVPSPELEYVVRQSLAERVAEASKRRQSVETKARDFPANPKEMEQDPYEHA